MATFNGFGANNDWFSSTNWSTASVPNQNDDVFINPIFGNQPSIVSAVARARSVLIDGDNQLTVRANGTLRVAADVRVGGGFLDALIIGSGGRVESDIAGVSFVVGVNSSSFGKIIIGAAVGALNSQSAGTLAENVFLQGQFSSFEFNAVGTATHSNTIEGLGFLAVRQGTAILTGANSYSGTTSIAAASILQVGDGGTSGSVGTGTIFNDGTLAFNRSNITLVNNRIEGGGNVTFAGGGSFSIFGENTYSAGTTIASGTTVRAGNGGTTGTLGSGQITNNGTLIFAQTELTFVGNTISGSGAVQVSFAKHVLFGNNTYSGGTTINSGATVQVGAGGPDGSLGTGAIVNNGSLEFFKTGAYTHNNTITGTGNLVVYTGTLTLGGGSSSPNTFSGGVFLSASNNPTLKAGKVNAFGAGSVTVSAGSTLDLNGFNQTVGSILSSGSISNTGASNTILTINGSTNSEFSGTITDFAALFSGALSISKSGAGSLILTGNNSYNGTTTVTNGILSVGSGGTTGSLGQGDVTFATILQFNRSNTVTVANNIASSSGRVEIGDGTTTGTYVFLGNNSYDRTEIRTGSTLQIGQTGGTTGSLGTGSVDNQGSLVFRRTMTVDNAISGNGSVTIGADVTFTKNNTYGQTTILDGNTLFIGNPLDFTQTTTGSLGRFGVSIGENARLVFQRNQADITVVNELSGLGSVEVNWGTVTLTATNTHSGGTQVSGATLNAGAFNVLGTGVFNSSGTFDLKGFEQTVTGITGGISGVIDNSAATETNLVVNGARTSAYFGTIADSGGDVNLTISGLQTRQELFGQNTYSGRTGVLDNAVLALRQGGSIANSNSIVLSGDGTLDIGDSTAAAIIRDLYAIGTGKIILGNKSLTVTALGGDTGALTFRSGTNANALNFTLAEGISGAGLADALFEFWGSDDTITLNGNILDNVFTGTSQADRINGLGGADTLIGGAGADILDGGEGTDTIDFANASTLVFVRLDTPTQYARFGSGAGGGIETDTLISIENATTGSGDDYLYGNSAANRFEAGGGNDYIEAGSGDDILIGGAGADVLDGGADSDTIDFANASTVVFVRLDTPTQYAQFGSGAGGAIEQDTLIAIENVVSGSGDDYLYGNSAANRFEAGGGNDYIQAGAGDDTVFGGAGREFVDGSYGNDIIEGGDEVGAGDTIYGGADNDIINGGDGDDALYGDHGADQLFGGNGVDVLFVDAADLALNGGVGINGGDGIDYIVWQDVTTAANINISAHSADYFYGFNGADIAYGLGATTRTELHGGNGNDVLIGSAGIGSILLGEGDNDRLVSETGIDYMVGGAGADTYVFSANGGVDFIYDFQRGPDRIDATGLAGSGIHAITDFAITTTYAASGWYGYGYATGTIWVNTGAAGSLTAPEFLFA